MRNENKNWYSKLELTLTLIIAFLTGVLITFIFILLSGSILMF